MRSIFVRVAELCLLVVIGTGVARAEQGLFFKGQGDAPAPVLGSTVEVRVTGIIARARVTQIFRNPSADWVEGIYIFPLPEDAAVDTLKMKIGDRTVVGEIQEKAEARKTYETAKKEGRKASLIEQQRPDVFMTSVANVGPGETVEIVIEMQQIVRWEAGRFRLRFPMVVAPRYSPPWTGVSTSKSLEGPLMNPPVRPAGSAPVNPFAFHVDLAAGFPLGRVTSPSHMITVEKGANHIYAVDLARSVAMADSDFILEWTPEVGREPRAVFYSEEVDGERYDLLMVMPPDASRSGRGAAPARGGVHHRHLRLDGGRVHASRRERPSCWPSTASSRATGSTSSSSTRTRQALFPDSVPVEPGALETARQYVSGLRADGGTDILAGVTLALEEKAPVIPLRGPASLDGLVRQITFVTDGQISNEAEVYQYLGKNLGDRRLFTVAIGPAPNVSFLRKSADLGRGTFTHISSVSEVAERMGALFAQLEAPMLRDLEVRWADPAAETWPARIPDLYLGEPLTVVGAARIPFRAGRGLGPAWRRTLAGLVPRSGRDPRRGHPQAVGEEEDRCPSWTAPLSGIRHRDHGCRRGPPHDRRARPAPSPGHALYQSGRRGRGGFGAERRRAGDPYRAGESAAGGGVRDPTTGWQTSSRSPPKALCSTSAGSPRGCTVSQTAAARGSPTSRDPWTVLRLTPGVLTDRISVGGDESGQATVAVGPGSRGRPERLGDRRFRGHGHERPGILSGVLRLRQLRGDDRHDRRRGRSPGNPGSAASTWSRNEAPTSGAARVISS